MTESADDEQILRLATSAAASLGAWQIAGLRDRGRVAGPTAVAAAPIAAGAGRRARGRLPETGGAA